MSNKIQDSLALLVTRQLGNMFVSVKKQLFPARSVVFGWNMSIE